MLAERKSRGLRLHALERTYRQARYLASVVRSRWFSDTQQTFDHISLTRAWNYCSQMEQERHRHVLSRLIELRGAAWGRALELGCYDGVFTEQLAAYCTAVLACDVSPNACARTHLRCAQLARVRTAQLNLESDAIPGKYDLIFAMDILNYVYGRDKMLEISSKLSAALADNGLLVITDCRLAPYIRDAWFQSWVPVGADNIVAFFSSQPQWTLLASQYHPQSGHDVGPDYLAHLIAFFEKAKQDRRGH